MLQEKLQAGTRAADVGTVDVHRARCTAVDDIDFVDVEVLVRVVGDQHLLEVLPELERRLGSEHVVRRASRRVEDNLRAAGVGNRVDADVAGHRAAGLPAVDADIDGLDDVAIGVDDQPGACTLVDDRVGRPIDRVVLRAAVAVAEAAVGLDEQGDRDGAALRTGDDGSARGGVDRFAERHVVVLGVLRRPDADEGREVVRVGVKGVLVGLDRHAIDSVERRAATDCHGGRRSAGKRHVGLGSAEQAACKRLGRRVSVGVRDLSHDAHAVGDDRRVRADIGVGVAVERDVRRRGRRADQAAAVGMPLVGDLDRVVGVHREIADRDDLRVVTDRRRVVVRQ